MTTRDEKICQMYIGGLTLRECAAHFHLSHERVRQILRQAGVEKQDTLTHEETPRSEFLGINVTTSSKEALQHEAAKQGVSMSRLASEILDEKLEQVKDE